MDKNLKDLFYESLDVLGISYERYGHMPYSLRKKTIAFDIYKQISDELKTGGLADERFYEKDIYIISDEELENHYKIIHACIALVCLGNNQYIKPLLGYLDFPEWRWTAKIDFLLSKLVKQDKDFRIPTFRNKIHWQKWFTEELFYTQLPDLSERILKHSSNLSINYYEYIVRKFSDKGIVKHESKLDKFSTFDELDFAEYYYINCYRYLANNDYIRLISFLDQSFNEQTIPYIETITNAVVDVFNDLMLNEDVEFWKKILTENEVDTLPSVLFSKILTKLFKDDSLAAYFVSQYIGQEIGVELSHRFESIYNATNYAILIEDLEVLLSHYEAYSSQVKEKIVKLQPYCNHYISSFITSMYQSEKQSILFFTPHRKPEVDLLERAFIERFKINSSLLYDISNAGHKASLSVYFFTSILNLYEKRELFLYKCLSRNLDMHDNLREEYIDSFTFWRTSLKDNDIDQDPSFIEEFH